VLVLQFWVVLPNMLDNLSWSRLYAKHVKSTNFVMGGVSSCPFNLSIYLHHNVMLQHLFKLDGFMWSPNVSFTGDFSPNPYLKNMISTYTKDFPWKKWPKFIRFWKKKSTYHQIFILVPVGSQKYRIFKIFSYFHISTCGQIWLNHFGDDSHLGSITKLEKGTLWSPM